MMASSIGESDLPDAEPRERSRSCSDEQRPQPKPRKRAARFQSVRCTGSGNRVMVRPGVQSASADSSPNLPRETRSRSILQPTPLVQALTNQLMSSLNQNSEEEANGGTQKVDADMKSVVNFFGSKSKHSPIVQRDRAHSGPKSSNAPPRPPPPAHPPTPNPRLNRLITDYHATSSGVHVINSRSKSKTPPSRCTATSAVKTTKYGTPPPTRPAPPPPKGVEKEKERTKGSPGRSQNSPVPKPWSSPLPRPRNAGNFNQGSASTTKVQKNVTKEPVDQTFPVYEDLDKDDDINNYERLDPSSSSEEENEPTVTTTQGGPSANDDAPPPLPPKKGSKIKLHKKEEELPPLPPRTRPPTTVRKHRLLANHSEVPDDKRKDSDQEENEEALQDTGVYEPVIYRDSDEESQKSQESYTEMNNPSMATDSDLENDQPEDIYITMDPHAYIPPPQTYKPKKKRAIFKAKQH